MRLAMKAPGAPERTPCQEVAMKIRNPFAAKLAASTAAFLALVVAAPAAAQDDTALFAASVAPNVVLMVDNSGSMNEIMWHPAYAPRQATNCPIFGLETPNGSGLPTSGSGNHQSMPYTCDTFSGCRFQLPTESSGGVSGFTQTSLYTCPDGTTRRNGYYTRTICGRTRKLFVDPDTSCKGNATWYSETYIEWLFSASANTAFGGFPDNNTSTDATKVDANRNGTHYVNGQPFPLFKRSRITAAKEVARDVIYQINSNCSEGQGFPCPAGGKDVVRFGIARFDGSDTSPGGFVSAPVGNYSANAAALDAAIGAIDAETTTPLGETLFKLYTYFMSRTTSERPFGVNNGNPASPSTTRFPAYAYRASDGDNTGTIPPDPLSCPPTNTKCSCQKNFVIMLTDGFPTTDDFAVPGGDPGRAAGFGDFTARLIGNYNNDGETEVLGSGGRALYLDDIAKFMAERDFRPDIADVNGTLPQTIDTYTVGLATDGAANALLQKTAQVGNGLFFTSTQAEELTIALVETIRSVIEKSQAFTAATVPATRTQEGAKFFNSLFVPVQESGYWEGSLLAWHITEDGEILDSNGDCAFEGDPNPCMSGRFDATAVPFWDAGKLVPTAGSRRISTSHIVGTTPTKLAFTAANITETHLNVALAEAATYAYQPPAVVATTAANLADMIAWNVLGCKFGTGFGAVACQTRTDRAAIQHRLGDIFHSNPVVVGRPAGINPGEPSYAAFKSPTGNPTIALRDQVIVAGANDGIFRIVHAGDWEVPAAPDPAGYDEGTGVEIAGFIPYSSRRNVKQIAKDSGSRDYYYTDGSPTVADVWMYGSPTVSAPSAKLSNQWKTVVVAGMRQGGNQYFALDITDPADANYPGYLWEFPRENDVAAITSTMGQTWSDPVITKIKVAVNGNLTSPQERWVAIFGGGYDRTGDPHSGFYGVHATAGRSITMLDIKTGRIIAQKKFVDTPAATDPALITYNAADPQRSMAFAIPSSPAVLDLDFDGFADVIYVGDLGGNVWKWVVKNVGHDPVNSTVTTTAQDGSEDGAGGLTGWYFGKFFNTSPYPAPPTAGPRHYRSFFYRPSATLKSDVLWLALGSGERAQLNYAGDTGTALENNRFFAIKDLDPLEQSPVTTPFTDASLLDLTTSTTCTTVTANAGYYIVADDGEKFVTNSEIIAFHVATASFRPQTSTDPCVSGGEAFFYFFNVYCRQGGLDASGTGAGNTAAAAAGTPLTKVSIGNGMPTDGSISLSESSGQVYINTGGTVVAKEIFPDLANMTRLAWWREYFKDPDEE
jgi:type IV pilus assembly protein PilY1